MNAENLPEEASFSVYLTLGSNVNPEKYLPMAIQRLKDRFTLKAVSSVWQTPAIGFRGEDFLNAAALIHTQLSARALKFKALRPLEAQLGRVRTENKFAPRTIDIDILLYENELHEKELWEQPHLAIPLAELYPSYTNQHTGESLERIARNLQSTSSISRRAEVTNRKNNV